MYHHKHGMYKCVLIGQTYSSHSCAQRVHQLAPVSLYVSQIVSLKALEQVHNDIHQSQFPVTYFIQ